MNLTLSQDRQLIRAGQVDDRYLLARVQAPLAEGTKPRLPLNIALVLDRSGSMGGRKIERVIEAACHAIDQLRDEDRFAVVAYDDRIDVIMRSTPASAEAKADAKRAVSNLTARGNTNLCDGWLRGCQQIAEYLQQQAIGRCLLLTDGLANSGVTNRNELVFHAENLRQRQVTTSTFGVGADFDEGLLSAIAEAGGGNFYFIEHAHDIPRFIAAELQETAEIVARDCTLQVTANIGCEVESLNEYPTTRTPDGWSVAVGSLVSGQVIEPLLRIRLPGTPLGESLTVSVRLQSPDLKHGVIEALATFRAAQDTDNDVQPRDVAVDRRRAALETARAQRRAALLNRERDFQGARREIQNAMERIRRYAGEDHEMLSLLERLLSDQEGFSRRDGRARTQATVFAGVVQHQRPHGRRHGPAPNSLGRGLLLLPATRDLVEPCQRAARAMQPSLLGAVGRVTVSERLIRSVFRMRAGDVLAPSDELGIAESAAHIGQDHAVRIVLTEARLIDNWFSHWHGPQRSAIVSQADWAQVGGLDRVAHIGYEALLYGLHAVTPRYDVRTIMPHPDTRGCLFDFCGDKRDIQIKLENMDLCRPCRTTLERLGIDTRVVLDCCAAVRELATVARGQPALPGFE